jgi:hypothetical protein
MTQQQESTPDKKNGSLEDDDATTVTDGPVTEDEFQVTIKKLDVPVRPRGVLAE